MYKHTLVYSTAMESAYIARFPPKVRVSGTGLHSALYKCSLKMDMVS